MSHHLMAAKVRAQNTPVNGESVARMSDSRVLRVTPNSRKSLIASGFLAFDPSGN